MLSKLKLGNQKMNYLVIFSKNGIHVLISSDDVTKINVWWDLYDI